MVDFILKHLKELLVFTGGIVVAVVATRYKEGIKKGTNFVIDSLLSWARIHFLMLKRYKKSIIKAYRETKVGYRNLRLDLERNYISLKVHSFVHYRQKEADEDLRAEKFDVLEVMKEHRHLVILGAPGAGKTTLMQWLLLKYTYGQMKEALGESLIPIFVALRSLESDQSVEDLLPGILKNHRFKGGEKYIRRQMEKGKCLLIFDGMDEIIDDATRKKFIDDICKIYGKLYGESRIIITSRTEGYPNDPFPQSFREREILDLDMEQVRNFVHGILKPEEKPEGLIRQIEKSEGLMKFVTNPLMLSLLTFVYQESYQKLPNERVKVYHKCMQLMMQDRDQSKGIYEYRNRFDPDDKELMLGKLAYDFSLENRWRFNEKELLEHWKKNRPVNLEEGDLKKVLKEVCTANGILKHQSGKELSFLHRTFQEYYAAKEISKKGQDFFEKTEDSIFEQFSKKEWHEITLFIVGMLDDSSRLIKQLAPLDPQKSLQCVVYAKRVKEDIIVEVLLRVFESLRIEYILEVNCNIIYLTHRFGLKRVTQYLSDAINKIKNEDYKKRSWEVIDHVMLTFSPQKGMVYVSSGAAEWGKKPGEWIPGFWMDIYPVSNANYQKSVDIKNLKELPKHWEEKSNTEPFVTDMMKLLPIVDVTYKNALSYSSLLNKGVPDKNKLRKAMKNDDRRGGILNGDKKKYLKKNKLEKSFSYYLGLDRVHDLARYLDRTHDLARYLARYLDRASARARGLARARDLGSGLNFDLARDLDRDLDLALNLARDLTLARDLARDRDLDLARDRDFARDLEHYCVVARDRASDLDLDLYLARDRDLASDLASDLDFDPALPFGFGKIKDHFKVAQKAARIIEKELNKSKLWTKEAWQQTFELGKALVGALVAFSEIFTEDVPGDLLKALREPGLLTPVNEFPPNDLGICGLVGYVWEWASTTNEKGEHLIYGGAWTEEKYEPDKEVWVPPTWRDINLGFRCVCDWDKIFDVKTPEEVAESSANKVEVKAEVEEEGE
jgi:hypothetical protein